MVAEILLIIIWVGLAAALYIGVYVQQKAYEPKIYPSLSVLSVCAVIALLVAIRYSAGPNPSTAADDPNCVESDCAPQHPSQL